MVIDAHRRGLLSVAERDALLKQLIAADVSRQVLSGLEQLFAPRTRTGR